MRITHSCEIPSLKAPEEVSTTTKSWRCGCCGQYWTVTYSGTSHCGVRSFRPWLNIRHWRWSRYIKRKIRA